MWYIAEQENDQMSLNGDLMRNITKAKKISMHTASFQIVVGKPSKKNRLKTVAKRKFVAVRCLDGVVPIVGCPWVFLQMPSYLL